jgi:hypothetical protein
VGTQLTCIKPRRVAQAIVERAGRRAQRDHIDSKGAAEDRHGGDRQEQSQQVAA